MYMCLFTLYTQMHTIVWRLVGVYEIFYRIKFVKVIYLIQELNHYWMDMLLDCIYCLTSVKTIQ